MDIPSNVLKILSITWVSVGNTIIVKLLRNGTVKNVDIQLEFYRTSDKFMDWKTLITLHTCTTAW